MFTKSQLEAIAAAKSISRALSNVIYNPTHDKYTFACGAALVTVSTKAVLEKGLRHSYYSVRVTFNECEPPAAVFLARSTTMAASLIMQNALHMGEDDADTLAILFVATEED